MGHETRNASYHAIDKLSEKQQTVYNAIESLKLATDKEVSHALNWEINRVTGRRNELIDIGRIEPVGKIFDNHTGRWLMQYRVKVKPKISVPDMSKKREHQFSLL